MELEKWLSAQEIADFKLLSLPHSKCNVISRAKKESWANRKRAGKGGGYEYAVASMPAEVQQEIRDHCARALLAEAAPAAQPEPPSAITPPQAPRRSLTKSQRDCESARMGILAEIDRLIADSGCSRHAAIAAIRLNAMTRNPAHDGLRSMFRLATDARGGTARVPSGRTIARWIARRDAQNLAPVIRTPDMSVPEWGAAYLAHYQIPSKPSVRAAYEQFLAHWDGDELPSIHQVRRFLGKIGVVSLQHGRLGTKELAAIQPFIRRSFSELMPCDIYSADGHTLDAEVLHPAHGRPFRAEITSVVDIATRKLVGWSAALSESALAVLEALTHAVQTNGIPNILYVDNGAGYRNAMMRDEAGGLMGRLGTQMIHSLPYNSQARGVIERLQRTVWVRGAKTLPTYIGADMDPEASHHVHKITRQALRQGKTVPLMMPWPDFVAWCQAQVDAYNDRPHRSLPKINDAGSKRHMTPNELWARKVAEGAVIHTTGAEDEHWLFRPQEFRVVRRCEVQLLNNVYFARALEEWHGRTVRVAYDIHDGGRVWIYDDAGRYICTAEANANRRAYLPQSLIERQADKRAAGRERRLQARLDEVQAERDGQRVIEAPKTIDFGALRIDAADLAKRGQEALARLHADAEETPETAAAITEAPAEPAWQVPSDPQERYALYQRLSALDAPPEESARWLQTYPTSNEYRALARENANNRSAL